MSDRSYNLSNKTHHLPQHTPSIPSSPKPGSPTLVEVLLPPAPPAILFSLVSDITQQGYPPVSLTLAETILALDPTLNATIRATAFGLATTVCQQTEYYSQCLAKAGLCIAQLE